MTDIDTPQNLEQLSRKMGHDLATLLYMTKDDYFYSAQWQAGMKSLNDFILAYEGVKNDK